MAKVIVLDDDQITLRALAAALKSAGHKVSACASVAEAMQALKVSPPDVLVTDFYLPGGVDGAEVARRAALQVPGVRSIVFSGLPSPRLKEVCGAKQVFRFLAKPFSPSDLVRLVQEAASSR